MKYILISFLTVATILGSTQLSAQSKDPYRDGVKAYNRHAYDDAIVLLKQVLQTKPNHPGAWYRIAMSHKKMDRFADADYAFKKLSRIGADFNPWFYLEAGEMYVENGKFETAKTFLDNFLEKYPDIPKNTLNRHKAKNRIEYAKRSTEIRQKENTTETPMPVTQIISISDDFSPQVSPTGKRFYFTSTREGGFDHVKDPSRPTDFGQDIYYSYEVYEGWSTPKLMPEPINSMNDDFGSTFTSDGQTMVYVRCGEKESVGSCDLYITQLEGKKWAEPKNMGNVVNSESWDSQPTISSDGSRIVFASTRKGGYGGIDLYVTTKNHLGDWGIPSNLGSIVNTPYKDSSPSLASDGKTLYFASDGHPGFGGQDIFYSLFDNGRWTKPLNVGSPINSSSDDKYFTTTALGKAYFASAKEDASNSEIYEVELPDFLKPKPSLVVQGKVADAGSAAPLEALVMVEDMDTGELLAVNKSNSETGDYQVVLPVGRNYSVSATKDSYFFYSTSFDLPKDTSYFEMTKNIDLEPITKGTKVVLNNIFFESGRAELKPISYVELNKAVELMQQNATMVIEIGGHTDNVGSEALNLSLSQKRAEAVKSYLELAQIEVHRLQAKGYGESVPLEDNSTAEGRKANRRTEFVIVEF
ncbi:MAG: PD40 domain-containing protein [Reichenbachiella sp.]